MSKVGKHAIKNSGSAIKLGLSGSSAHAIPRGKSKSSSGSKGRRTKPRIHLTLANVIRTLLILAVFVVMITPLQSCILNDDGYIGISEAKKAALTDVGLSVNTKISDVQSELIKLDGAPCYKLHFKTSSADYRFIVDAVSGEVVARAYDKIETENPY